MFCPNICTKTYVARGDTIIYGIGAFLWCVLVSVPFVWPVFSTVVYISVQIKAARNAFRGSIITPQHMAFVFFICHGPIFVTDLGFMFQ